MPSA
jgi:transcriptional regulator with XRE-family HTH domain